MWSGLVYLDGLACERGVVALKPVEVDALCDAPALCIAAVSGRLTGRLPVCIIVGRYT